MTNVKSSALVINTKTNPLRWRMQSTQLELLGISGSRLEAATPDTLSPPASDPYWFGWRKEMSPVEKAILCSHRACWRIVAESGKPWLILEDDVVLSPSIADMLEKLEARDDLEYVQLETVPDYKLISTEPATDTHGVRRLFRDSAGSACYWLTPRGAEKLLSATDTTPMPSDVAISLHENLKKLQAWPALGVQAGNARDIIKDLPSYLLSSRANIAFAKTSDALQKLNYLRRRLMFMATTRALKRRPPRGFTWKEVPFAEDLRPFASELMSRLQRLQEA